MDFCSKQAETNRRHGIHIIVDVLTGMGQFDDLEQQLNYYLQAYN